MAIEFKKAKRSLARLKIGMTGASGSGKTLSSLLMAYGLIKAEHPEYSDAECWEKICIIDTENSSGSLYVNTSVGQWRTGEYNTIVLEPPYEASKYIDAIHVAEQNDQQVIIIDSLTHAWSGEGGALDKQGKIAARTGNSYTAWRDITPEHNRLVDAMLQSKAHIIADIRAKTDYAQVKDERGKTKVQNVGLAPVFRDGIEYEFTVCFMLDSDHIAEATKDRTALFDGKFFTITPDTGRDLYRWLDEGGPIRDEKPAPQMQKVSEVEKAKAVLDSGETEFSVTVEDVDRVVKAKFAGLSGDDRKTAIAELKLVTGGVANYMTITDPVLLKKIYNYYKEN